jgi:CRISPR-associated protein Cas1
MQSLFLHLKGEDKMPFRTSKTLKIELSNYGSYLGRDAGCFEVRNKNGEIKHYPHFEKQIGECVLKSGSYVSTDALIDLALWNIDTYIMTKRNRVVAVLKNLEDDSHVKTRIAQYQALNNGKGDYVAKQIVKHKVESQNKVLTKYGLKPIGISFEDLDKKKLLSIEAKSARVYFNQIFKLFPEKIRPEKRVGYKAYDGINNVFNFGYYVLKCRVHKALLKARLEPYLGFLHSTQFGKPSLVCDFQELYRYLIDDFLIERAKKFHKKDFVAVTDFMMKLKMGKRIHLCEYETDSLAEDLNGLFGRIVDIPRIKHGNKQTIDTLISEETFLLAKYLRNELKYWKPRIPNI